MTKAKPVAQEREVSRSKSPDEQLAQQIAAELVKHGFATDARRSSLEIKLATGQMTDEEWRVFVSEPVRSKPEEGA